MNDSNEEFSSRKNKSDLKRQGEALQKLGEALVKLPVNQLATIPLDSTLREAVYFARSLKSHEAMRRQLQYIGKLMRHVEAEPIQLALEKIAGKNRQTKAIFHQIERWRDLLIAEGDGALQKFIDDYPQADRQHLRQLVRKAQQDQTNNKKTGGETELFRYLRGLVDI